LKKKGIIIFVDKGEKSLHWKEKESYREERHSLLSRFKEDCLQRAAMAIIPIQEKK